MSFLHLEITETSFGALARARSSWPLACALSGSKYASKQTNKTSCSLTHTYYYKFSEAPEALRARFFARLARLGARTCSFDLPRDARSFDFRTQNGCFFEFFACEQRATRKASDIEKTLQKLIRNALRSFRAFT